MNKRKFRTYFFTVHSDTNESNFSDCLASIYRLSPEDRTIDVNGVTVRLAQLDYTWSSSGLLCGDFERLQMDDLPPKSRISGEQEELELDDDQGLGHTTAFIYNVQMDILALQNNITGVGAARIQEYLTKLLLAIGRRSTVLHIRPFVLPEGEARAILDPERDLAFRKLIFTITNPDMIGDSLAHLPGNQSILYTFAQAASLAEAVKLTVSLSVGTSRTKSLIPDKVINTIKEAIGLVDDGVEVEKLIVSGVFDGENQELNMLPYKLSHLQEIKVDRSAVPFIKRRNCIKYAFDEHFGVLQNHCPLNSAAVITVPDDLHSDG